MLKAISLADASVHLLRNQAVGGSALAAVADWVNERLAGLGEQPIYLNEQLVVTLILGVVGFVFWFLLRKGFNRNVLIVSVPLIAAYLLLNGLLLGAGIQRLVESPEIVDRWLEQVQAGEWVIRSPNWAQDWWGVVLMSLVFLPSVALGLSGFELSMI